MISEYPTEQKDNTLFYYLITPANVRDVSDIADYARDNEVNFGHYVSYYKKDGDSIYVIFVARLPGIFSGHNDFEILGGNPNGIKIELPK